MKQVIHAVTPDSIASALGVMPGDCLLAINGKKIHDIFDYRYLTQAEKLRVTVEKPDGALWALDIEKDAFEDLGLVFSLPLMDRAKQCQNKCVFCFIDQLPPDMRETLYFKDDDPRLSFLTGNYVTLTNISMSEARRIARYHLSPLRVSVHTTDKERRCAMMNNPHAGRLMTMLRIFNDAGITLHFQIVLCKGINDGPSIDRTIKHLLTLQPGAASLSIVPAGLTRHRDGLYPLASFTATDALAIIQKVTRWQKRCRKRFGTAFVHCADEFYLLANVPTPPYKSYEDFPQLENGVGMLALFEHAFLRAIKKDSVTPEAADKTATRIGIVTGMAAEPLIKRLTNAFMARHPRAKITVFPVENRFFGPGVTVSGLLTGRDVVDMLAGKMSDIAVLFLPSNMLRDGEAIMLDGMTPAILREQLGGVQVLFGGKTGGAFYKQLKKVLYS